MRPSIRKSSSCRDPELTFSSTSRLQVRRTSHPQGVRLGVEAGSLPEQRRQLRRGACARWPRKLSRLISTLYSKDPTDPTWDNDPGMLEWRAFMKKYYPDGDLTNNLNVGGFSAAYTLVHVLRQCGDNLTRENIMRQASSLKDFSGPTALPGVSASTSPSDYPPTKTMQPVRFD